MQWISDIFQKSYKLDSSISKKCWKFIASKMLEIKSQHLTWGGPYSHDMPQKHTLKTLSNIQANIVYIL